MITQDWPSKVSSASRCDHTWIVWHECDHGKVFLQGDHRVITYDSQREDNMWSQWWSWCDHIFPSGYLFQTFVPYVKRERWPCIQVNIKTFNLSLWMIMNLDKEIFISFFTDWMNISFLKPTWLFHFSQSFHLPHFQPNQLFCSGLHRNEDKQTRNLVSFHLAANFKVWKMCQGNVQSLY